MNPKIILIVDDEPDVVAYLRVLLEDNGYETVTASNGKEGFDAAKKLHPALITLDVTMPEESGVRMFRDLQEDSKLSTIPVIMVTGVSGDFQQFISSRRQVRPPDAYFEKPIDKTKFVATVNRLTA